jgi:glutathione S-transferase
MTELGVTYTVRQVPVEREDRAELVTSTGQESIPVLVANGDVIAGEDAIVAHLNTRFDEPLDAERQRAKAATAKRKELEEACPKLEAATR